MTKDFIFLDWPVYKDAQKVINEVFGLTAKFPPHFRYELGGQMNRSAISIVLNIAEGSGKNSKKDFAHFLNISMGSLYETVAGFDIAKSNGLISETQFESVRLQLAAIARQIGGLKKKLSL